MLRTSAWSCQDPCLRPIGMAKSSPGEGQRAGKDFPPSSSVNVDSVFRRCPLQLSSPVCLWPDECSHTEIYSGKIS